jgi:hypothetical protein
MAFDQDWNLCSISNANCSNYNPTRWGANNDAGVLTLRTTGNLKISANLSDAFDDVVPEAGFEGGNSWAYRLVAGANLNRADPLAVALTGNGSYAQDADILVRTGTGNIDVAAKGDIRFANAGSVLYTAGDAAPSLSGFTAPTAANIQGTFAVNGGNINLHAGGDIVGVSSRDLFTQWLYREGRIDPSSSPDNPKYFINSVFGGPTRPLVGSPGWWINFAGFRQGVGALGGGNVDIAAGGSVKNLSVSIPTSGEVTGQGPADAQIHVMGGGNLRVKAGADILSGIFDVGLGKGELIAGGSIATASGSQVGTLLAIGNAGFSLFAHNDVGIDAAFNPTLLPQVNGNLTSFAGGVDYKSHFSTYGTASALTLTSLTGNATLAQRSTASIKSWQAQCTLSGCGMQWVQSDQLVLSTYPGTVKAIALNGDVLVPNNFSMAPSATGTLELLAARNVTIAGVTVSDADPSIVPRPINPSNTLIAFYDSIPNGHAITPAHARDTTGPVRIVAQSGSIAPAAGSTVAVIGVPKAAELYAGVDIQDMRFSGQNLGVSDVTQIVAGRDVRATEAHNAVGAVTASGGLIQLGGPGLLQVQAGRNVDLGSSVGILTRGNIVNPALPAQGAGLVVLAGVKTQPDYDGFAARYLDPSQNLSRDYSVELSGYIANFAPAPLTGAAAYALFRSLTAEQRASFVRTIFFNELRETGRAVNQSGATYDRGYNAIRVLFPDSTYKGDIKLYYSQIKSEGGGGLELLAPGGLVNAGLAVVPKGLTKPATQLGVVTVNGGSVESMQRGDFQVNQSRVFTLGGGDITIWSSQGDIDAGKGSKTASLASPPVVTTDSQGNVVTVLQGAATGSGIGLLLTKSGITPGSVDLIAPNGTVNAGDAGIRSAGNLNIAAARVVGAENITVSGLSTGVPKADTGGLGAGLSGATSGAGAEAGKAADQAAQRLASSNQNSLGQPVPSIIIVEVLGLGE